MPYIEYPKCYLFFGRRKDLTPLERKLLKRIKYEHRMFVEIFSLDQFAVNASTVINLVNEKGKGSWSLPLQAYTHYDLTHKLPSELFDWLSHPNTGVTVEYFREYRLSIRQTESKDYIESDKFY